MINIIIKKIVKYYYYSYNYSYIIFFLKLTILNKSSNVSFINEYDLSNCSNVLPHL